MIADGALVKQGKSLELRVPGLKYSFVLAGGPQAGALDKRGDLVGKKIRVAGKLSLAHADHPPGLTVEKFQSPP